MRKQTNENVKKQTRKRWLFWIALAVVLRGIQMATIGSLFSGGEVKEATVVVESTETTTEETTIVVETTEETTTEEETTVVETEKETTEEISKEQEMREEIKKVVGEEDIELFNYVPSNNFSLIKFRGNESLTKKMTVEKMYLDMFNILEKIQPFIDTDVDFNVVYPLQDRYGNVSDSIVIKATFKNETIKKINFENALFGNIPDMADEWWQHNALNID